MNKKILLIFMIFMIFVVACSGTNSVSGEKVTFSDYKNMTSAMNTSMALTKLNVKFSDDEIYSLSGDTRNGNFSNFLYDNENNVIMLEIGLNTQAEFPYVIYAFELNDIINTMGLILAVDAETYSYSNEADSINCQWVEKDSYGYNGLACDFALKTIYDDGSVVQYIGEVGAVFFEK